MAAIAVPAGAAYSATGLQLPPDLSWEAWCDVGAKVGRLARASPWLLGDWLRHGERAYGVRYAQAVDVTGLDYTTLRNYASVCARVPLERRRATLTFSHHEVVAALAPGQQDAWLDDAEADRLTVAEFRARLRAAHVLADEAPAIDRNGRRQARRSSLPRRRQPADALAHVHLRVDAERLQRWRSAAAAAGAGNLNAWIGDTLDRAALAELGQLV